MCVLEEWYENLYFFSSAHADILRESGESRMGVDDSIVDEVAFRDGIIKLPAESDEVLLNSAEKREGGGEENLLVSFETS